MNYRFNVRAKDDLRDAVVYYELQRLGLGAEFAVEVGIGIARILDAPRRWSEVEPGVRKYRLDRFPYGIIYRLPSPQQIEIIAIFDLRRRPDSWKDRLP